MTDIFISYARSESDKVERLASALEAAGHSVWWDRQISGGAAYAAEIETALRRASCVIVAWSVKAVQSEWVLDEAGLAKDKGRLVPIGLDATPPPLGFRQQQTLDFSGWQGDGEAPEFQRLCNSITRLLDRNERPESAPSLSGSFADALAVLPLENLTGDASQQYLVDGLHEAIIVEISKVEALKVISRTSAKRFADTALSLREIAAELNVSKLVEGSVMRMGDRLRISVRLIDARSDSPLWSEQFTRELTELFELQQEVAQEIAGQTSAILKPADHSRLGSQQQVSSPAYDLYLKGMYHWYKLSPENIEAALDCFDRALALDPDFALAHTGIAMVWAGLHQMGVMAPRLVTPKIRSAAERALELDPDLFQAHLARATYMTWSEWNWPEAEQAFRHAIALNPNFPDSHAFYSHYLNIVGRFEEAEAAARRALDLDPFNPLIHALQGVNLFAWQRYEDCIETSVGVRKTMPYHWLPLQVMRLAYRELDQPQQVFESNCELYRLLDKPSVVTALEEGFRSEGQVESARRAAAVLVELSRESYISALQVATMFDLADQADRAAEWVERGFQQRDPELPYVRHVKILPTALHEHPKMREVFAAIGLSD